MKETYFITYTSYLEPFESLSDAELGRLYRAAIKYAAGIQIDEFKGNEKIAFAFVKNQIDRDIKKYEEKCETNRKNGALGGKTKNERQILANGSEQFLNLAFAPNEKEKEKEKEKTQENNDIISHYVRNNILVKSQKIGTRLSGTNPRKTGTSPSQLGVSPKQLIEQKFEKFWDVYPKKVAKQAALKAFIKISNLEATHEKILEGVERWKASNQWKDPQFIPHPTTFLNGRRWEDEIPEGGENYVASNKPKFAKATNEYPE
jgi:hypothetical protein